jgi:hypothetical protein
MYIPDSRTIRRQQCPDPHYAKTQEEGRHLSCLFLVSYAYVREAGIAQSV